jgi:hypothetical protein
MQEDYLILSAQGQLEEAVKHLTEQVQAHLSTHVPSGDLSATMLGAPDEDGQGAPVLLLAQAMQHRR